MSDPQPDGCPECVANVEEPWITHAVEGGIQCAYVCSDCGAEWTANYQEESC